MKEIESILETALSGKQIPFGLLAENKNKLEQLPFTWMTLEGENAKNRKRFFLKNVERDNRFNSLVEFVDSRKTPIHISRTGEINMSDEEIDNLKAIIAELEMFLRFVAIAYIGQMIGLLHQTRYQEIWGDGSKYEVMPNENLVGCYRINYWHAPSGSWNDPEEESQYKSIVSLFGIESMAYSWDGETAISLPVKIENGVPVRDEVCNHKWDFKNKGWCMIMDCYLLERGADISPGKERRILEGILKKDEILNGMHSDISTVVNEALGIDNLYDVGEKYLKDLIEILKHYDPKSGLCLDKGFAILQDFSGPHKSQGWDVRISSSILHVFYSGRVYRLELDPYYEYEDFPGGKTHEHPHRKVEKITSVKFSEEACLIEVVYADDEKATLEAEQVDILRRKREKGSREHSLDRYIELNLRLSYKGDPSDLNVPSDMSSRVPHPESF